MIILKGYVLLTIGGAMLLASLGLFFPKAFINKKDPNYQAKVDGMKISKKSAIITLAVGILFIVLWFIFKF